MGNFGIWDVNYSSKTTSVEGSAKGIYQFRPHVGNITSLHVWGSSSEKVYSTSYDGTVRYFDLNTESFQCSYEVPEDLYDVMITDAGYLRDGNSILLGMNNGTVSLLDTRSKSRSWNKEFQATKINSIQQSPSDEYLVMTAGSGMNGHMCLHDLRMVYKPKYTHIKALDR